MKNQWIVLEGATMICQRCCTREQLQLPVPLDKILDIMRQFDTRHRECQPQKENEK